MKTVELGQQAETARVRINSVTAAFRLITNRAWLEASAIEELYWTQILVALMNFSKYPHGVRLQEMVSIHALGSW